MRRENVWNLRVDASGRYTIDGSSFGAYALTPIYETAQRAGITQLSIWREGERRRYVVHVRGHHCPVCGQPVDPYASINGMHAACKDG